MKYERLTVRFSQAIEMKKCDRWNNCSNCSDFKGCPKIYEAIDRLAELEDMIESGQIRILPCKLGDHIYVITRLGNFIDLDEYVVDWFDTYNIDDQNIGFYFNGKDVEDYHLEFCGYDTDFGKTVFLTRKEAEAKLEKLKNKENEVKQ